MSSSNSNITSKDASTLGNSDAAAGKQENGFIQEIQDLSGGEQEDWMNMDANQGDGRGSNTATIVGVKTTQPTVKK